MPTYAEVESFALTLPETTSSPSYGAPALRVNDKLFARLRVEMAEEYDEVSRTPYGEVLMLRVADLGEKEALLASDPRVFFTVAHYEGHASVLIRVRAVDPVELRELVLEAWLNRAPRRAVTRYVKQGGALPGA